MVLFLSLFASLVAGSFVVEMSVDDDDIMQDDTHAEDPVMGKPTTGFMDFVEINLDDPAEDALNQGRRDGSETTLSDDLEMADPAPMDQIIYHENNSDADDDIIQGSTLADAIYGDAGFDQIGGGGGNDTLHGGTGDDFATGQDGDDIVYGDTGNDTLDGADGRDTLYGGSGNDAVNGWLGHDTLYGDDGRDTLTGGQGHDILFGGAQDDKLSGGYGDDALYGGVGTDTMFGGRGDDIIIGQGDTDRDFVNGGDGDDVLILGAADYGNGGTGYDTFVLDANAVGPPVIITDFSADDDRLKVKYDPTEPMPVLAVTLASDETTTVVSNNGQVLATLMGAAALSVADIILVPK